MKPRLPLDRASGAAWRVLVLLAALAAAPGCLVLSLHPVYGDETIAWDPALVGAWEDAEDRVSLRIEPGEWKSYRVHYEHPIETGELTAYLTLIDDEKYLDVMPARGHDYGSFLVPVHALVRLRVNEGRLELTPFSYDWFLERVRARKPPVGLSVVSDQKENALIVSPVAALRRWLRGLPPDGAMFGPPVVFTRTTADH